MRSGMIYQSAISLLFFIVALLMFSLPVCSSEGQVSGKVIGISDGDTIEVLQNGTQIKLRLWGIDCPESSQPFGNAAKKFTSDLAFGKIVRFQSMGLDRYGRTIAKVYLPDGKYLSAELIAGGYAWWFRKYAPDEKDFEDFEEQARKEKKGLWKDPRSISPWQWRAGERENASTEQEQTAETADTANLPGLSVSHLHCNGAGEKEPDEYAELLNSGTAEIDMTGWVLHDEGSNHEIVFQPGFRLHPGQRCKIFTNEDSGCLSFHEEGSAIWNNSGDKAYLLDQQGRLVSSRGCDD